MRDYKKYEVWQNAHALTLLVYRKAIPLLPANEQYALASQLKRATTSIALNIAEGCGRNSDKDFVHFLDIALGSTHETEYCNLLAKDLEFFPEEIYEELNKHTAVVKAKLINLIKSIRL
jgi:four helix bundle protein